jgi:hypothetical protein
MAELYYGYPLSPLNKTQTASTVINKIEWKQIEIETE